MADHDPLRTSVADDLGSLAGYVARPPHDVAALAPGTAVGEHFTIEAPLGEGGMGIVYRAHDRALDRRVALKLGTRSFDVERARREAQALARIAHPNVVTIHEIGEHEGRVFVAMELCGGGTVRTWQRAAPRTWREIVEVYVAAGRGLHAAHAAGLVHRDVKPDNILLGDDGRARIADFGLARGAYRATGAGASGGDLDRDATTIDATPAPGDAITEAGVVVGTPRYMAPEQRAGEDVDARADQYAFCVSLRESLGPQLPRQLRALLGRGSASAPADRYPSMEALLAELAAAARPRRWWIVPAALALAGALAATWWVARDAAPVPPGCEPAAVRLRGVWDPATRASLLAHDPGLANVADAIDARVAEWTSLRTATCRDVRKGREQAASAYARLHCLDQRLADVAAVVSFQREAARAAVGADALFASLPALDLCADPAESAIREPQPDGAAARARVASDRAIVQLAEGLVNVGRFDEAEAALARLATPDAFPPLGVEAAFTRAGLLAERGDLAEAMDAYRRVVIDAAAARHPEVQIAAQLDLALYLAQSGGDLDARARAEVESLLGLAEATWRAAGGAPWLEAHVLGNRAGVKVALGDLTGAVEDARRCHEVYTRLHGPHATATLNAASALASTLLAAGRNQEASEVLTAALTEAEATLPPTHAVLRSLVDLMAATALRRRDLQEARRLRERAVQLTEAALGPDHPELDDQRLNLTALLGNEGRFGEILPLVEQVLAARARRGDDRSPTVAMLEANRAMALSHLGRLDDALTAVERCVALFETALGADHPMLIEALVLLSTIRNDRGELELAVAAGRRGLAIAEKALPADSPLVANPLGTLAMILAPSQPAAARPLAERALRLAASPDVSPATRGEAELALSMALDGLDQRARARELADRAVATLTAAGPVAAPSRQRAERWVTTLGAREPTRLH